VSSIGPRAAVECQLAIALAQRRHDALLLGGFRGGLVPAFAASFAFAAFLATTLAAAWVAFAFAAARVPSMVTLAPVSATASCAAPTTRPVVATAPPCCAATSTSPMLESGRLGEHKANDENVAWAECELRVARAVGVRPWNSNPVTFHDIKN
jgi:hypothetical protein